MRRHGLWKLKDQLLYISINKVIVYIIIKCKLSMTIEQTKQIRNFHMIVDDDMFYALFHILCMKFHR